MSEEQRSPSRTCGCQHSPTCPEAGNRNSSPLNPLYVAPHDCCDHCTGDVTEHAGPCPTCEREGAAALADGEGDAVAAAAAALSRSQVVAELRALARSWDFGPSSEIAVSAVLDAAAHFEGTL